MTAPFRRKTRISRIHLSVSIAYNRQRANIIISEKSRAQTIVQIVIVVGNIIRQGCNLRYSAGVGVQLKIVTRGVLRQRKWPRLRHGAIMLCNAFKTLPRQV